MNKVLIVDDHPVARFAIRALLEKAGLEVSGECDDGVLALQMLQKLSPDLVIVDIDIPSVNGIDVVKRMRDNNFRGGILVLTGKEGEHYVRRSATAGADGFISKRNQLAELNDAIRAIRGGYGYFPVKRARFGAAQISQDDDKSKVEGLSTKELVVLRYLAQGIRIVEIADKMNISDKTVSTYKNRMMKKLELKNMVDIFDFAQRNNLD